ncbi:MULTISPECIES: MFS transporter [Bradyrhizobium]|uniref:MFS transporter n=1 Tax=Bradyrhizobium TaxID=374 RepID=UPI000420D781|nr:MULTISPECIES: MFS transporter [Bradyrhizobium]MCP1738174.1 MFS family permease [Bradyrhizobium japonicum]MCP1776490.1 MFS family permease [Bradyrhizobium japonicum]MCP1855958.1 MFS family permease [Bradyrhizobium japonicum]MCP1897227.1 MFS family permease [Bradyrhizobium japonicum]MCP1960511.1 MFS family permease [Bradyrhizobium japonicum]
MAGFLLPEGEGQGVTTTTPNAARAGLPRGIWVLGFVSMLMDVSSEMIHALLPVYLVTVLGASTLTVGFIEGIAEATASITKIFSGALSDWLGRRKLLAALGYGLAALTKPLFPLAPSVGWLIAARFIDRVGKGIRGAPRDALIADVAPAGLRGASFGLRQSLDTIGAFVGPLVAIGLMWWTADNFALVFWVAVLPAFLSFGLIAFAVSEPEPDPSREPAKNPLNTAAIRQLGSAYWRVVAVGVVFTLARFSEAFLILRAQNIGLSAMWVPAVLVLMNVAYALSAYPAGVLSDRINRTGLLALGLVFLAAADLALALLPSLAGLALGVVLWGLHMGLTQGLLLALVADAAPPSLRGTAFGYFNLFTGLALLAASVIAGALWDAYGPAGTFLAGLGFALVALAGLLAVGNGLAAEDK